MNVKTIIIFGGIGLAVVGGGYAALQVMGGEGSAEAGEESEEGHEPQPSGHEKPKPSGHEKPKASGHGAAPEQEDGENVVAKQMHVVNAPGGKTGFLRCGLSFVIRDSDLGKQMASDTPTADMEEAKSIVLGILRALSAEELSEPESQEALRLDIMDRLNDRFGGSPSSDKALPPRHKEPIKEVFITEWAVQR